METSFIREREVRSGRGRDNLFVWTIFLLGLAGVAFACWLGSFYVFGHPEQPRSYRILRKLNRLPSPTRFLVTKAPPGDFLDAQKIYERYSRFTNLQLDRENQIHLRNYIKNYTETKKLVPYLTGKYQVLSVYELRANDFFPSGLVALTQAVDFPQVLVELVYTANPENMEDIKALVRPGVEIRLDRTLDLSAVVHVGRAQDGRLHLTVVPLLYGQYALKNGLGSFSLEPPKDLNVGSGLPLIRGEEVRAVFREQMEQRKKRLTGKPSVENSPEPSAREVVRMDLPKTGNDSEPSASALPASGASSPKVAVSPEMEPSPEASKNAAPKTEDTKASGSALVVDAGRSPKGSPPSSASSPAVPPAADNDKNRVSKTQPKTPVPDPSSPPKVLPVRQGGIAAGAAGSPSVAASVPNKTAPAGAPVGAPPGKSPSVASVSVPQTTVLASATKEVAPPRVTPVAPTAAGSAPQQASPDVLGGYAGASVANRPVVVATPAMNAPNRSESWRTYGAGKQPQGRSVSLDQAVGLRGRNDGAPVYLRGKFFVTAADRNQAVMRQESSESGGVPTRIIVEYPAGMVPPARGSSVVRNEGRGFEIREVKRGADGHVNVFVREVFTQ